MRRFSSEVTLFMIRKLYDQTLALAASRHAMPALGAVSFIEASIFPIPPDVLLIPMALADRQRAFRFATVCTLSSILGGLFGYFIGFALFETVGRAILDLYGGADQWFQQFQTQFNEWGFWWVAFAGFTPFPYKVITIAAGVTKLDLATFLLASILSRGARFYLVAALLWYFGPAMRDFIERRLGLLSLVFFVLLAGRLPPDRRLIDKKTQGEGGHMKRQATFGVLNVGDLRLLALLLAGASATLLAAAYVSEYGFGLKPCTLCLWQRWPHFAIILLGLLASRAAPSWRIPFLSAMALLLLLGAGIAFFHVGVEQKWWAGLASCGGAATGADSVAALRAQLVGQAPVRCDEPALVVFGLSMAGWNGLISFALAAATLYGVGTTRARRSARG